MKKLFRRLLEVVCTVFMITGCAAFSSYESLKPQIDDTVCPSVYSENAFQAVHRIEMDSARTGKSIFIGAVTCEPVKEKLHAVLMSVEGLVLFEAEVKKGALRIISAIPPLDDPTFARGLTADVSFLLLGPAGHPVEKGMNGEGMATCRWLAAEGYLLEQTLLANGAIRVRQYNQIKRIVKEALALPPFDRGLSSQMKLLVSGLSKYAIELTLVEVNFID